jgi:hypothetical protein
MKHHDDAGKPVSTDQQAKPVAKGAAVGGVAGGVAGGATAGALAGGMTGPVGAVVGAAAGAVVGAMASKRKVDPVAEDRYWRDNYAGRPYVASGTTYDDYEPAYRYGTEAYSRYPDRDFDEVESELGRDWHTTRGKSSLEWDHAKHATRDAWQRMKDGVERAMPGDSDRDGK